MSMLQAHPDFYGIERLNTLNLSKDLSAFREGFWSGYESVARLTFSLKLSSFKEFRRISVAEMDLYMDLFNRACKFCEESPAPFHSTKFHESPQLPTRNRPEGLAYEGKIGRSVSLGFPLVPPQLQLWLETYQNQSCFARHSFFPADCPAHHSPRAFHPTNTSISFALTRFVTSE